MLKIKSSTFFSRVFSTLLLIALLTGIFPTITLAAPKETQTNNDITFTQLDLYPNIETIGIVVSGIDLPETAELFYRQDNETLWRTGHPLMRIGDGRLVGSLFELSPTTTYTIKVISGTQEIISSTTTQPEELQFTPSTILHVDANAAPGGDGSVSAPFQKIQDGVNYATPGTQVLVADGIYQETITFPNSGSEANWIQVKAAGSGAILDGSQNFSGNIWNPYKKANVWSMKVDHYFEYLARDQERFYNYSNLKSLLDNTRGEGWYLEKNTLKLYVRTLNDPSQHTWQMPYLNRAFDIDSCDWLWIEGFEMRFYGTQTNRSGVYAKDASHLVIRKNKIHHVQLGIYINWTGGDDRGSDTRIEYNEIYDPPVNEWAWTDVKGSSMEGTGIVLRGHIGAIVRENDIHNFFNGIYTGSGAANALRNTELAFDIDIYDNDIYDIGDDAIEPEGACVNHRFRNNTINSAFVGLSVAPVTIGPTWILRSTFSNYTERGIKWDKDADGIVLLYHNTFWTTAQDIAAMDFISPADNATLRNNIFQNNGYAIYEVRSGSKNHAWDNNNWYSAHVPPIKWEGTSFADLLTFCATTGLACNSHAELPGLANPKNGDFSLNSSSPNIDRGVVISGINDGFSGSAPDIGAYEYRSDPPIVLSILRTEGNPTAASSVNFTIIFSEPVTGLSLSPPFNNLVLTTSLGTSDASITGVIPISEMVYTVSVNTGSGSGTIRLDLLDDNTLISATGNPLGGIQLGDGDFITGESYTIEKTPTATPEVISTLEPASDETPTEWITETFTSNGRNDGWVLESSENSDQGDTKNKKSDTLIVGDDAQNNQYRSILDFMTRSLPNDVVITDAMLMIKKQDISGTNPFTTHQNILVDIQYGGFGFVGPFQYRGLQSTDFQSPACQNAVGIIQDAPMGDWYWAILDSTAFHCINPYGVTQFRLRFEVDDNNDMTPNSINFYSGNYDDSVYSPRLIIKYDER